jgi:hypothetical protein
MYEGSKLECGMSRDSRSSGNAPASHIITFLQGMP